MTSRASITTDEQEFLGWLDPIHPGEVIREDVIEPLGMTVADLANVLHVPEEDVEAFVNGRARLTIDFAGRLSRWLGTSAKMWLGLQMEYDLRLLRGELAERIEREVTPREPEPAPA